MPASVFICILICKGSKFQVHVGNISHIGYMYIYNWGCPADLLTNHTVLDPKVHCHTLRAPLAQVGIESTSLPTKVVALPTKHICTLHFADGS